MLVHEIDIIIYVYEIDQIQVIFYLVSTFKLHCYEYTRNGKVERSMLQWLVHDYCTRKT